MRIAKYVWTSMLAAGLVSSAHAGVAENKDAAINAMVDIFAKQEPLGVERYFELQEPYIQHNTRAPDGIGPLRKLAQDATNWKGVHTTAYRALGEGDLVVLHSVYSNLMGAKITAVAFDLFRFKNGKIIEHWDSLEPGINVGVGGVSQVNGARDITDLDKSEANRKLVLEFIDKVLVAGQPQRAAEFIDTKKFISHNLHKGDGLERKLASFVAIPGESKPLVQYVKVHRTIADGNFIFVQAEGKAPVGKLKQAGGGMPAADMLEIYDLYRVQGGKIVEHWDVLQPLGAKSEWANPNGPF